MVVVGGTICAQRITSGLFELLLHAFCKHFYWIYYTLAINFRANMKNTHGHNEETQKDCSTRNIFIIIRFDQDHTNEIMSFRLTSQSAAAVAAILLMPFREYLSADDEQQGKHDDLVVDGMPVVAEAQF